MSTVDIAPELVDLPHVPVTALEPFQGNLKELSQREYNKLKKSLEENGVIVPFFVWQETGKLLDGHQRQRVFAREGWQVDVPVVYISAGDEQDAKRKLLVISSQYGKVTQEGWDEFTFDLDDEWLAETVQFDALPFVFGEWGDDAEPMESEDAEPQVNRAEELRAEWGVELGQMWRLPSRTPGQEHRLICGDCTDADVVKRVMGGEKAKVCFTSPPYAQQRDYTIASDISNWDALMIGAFGVLPMASDGQVFVNLGLIHRDNEWQTYWDDWIKWMREKGWRRFGLYVWDQGPGMPGDWAGRFAPAFEFVFHFNKQSVKPNKTKKKLPDSIEINDHGGGHRKKDGTVSRRSNPEASLQTHKIPDSVIRVMRHKARGIETSHVAVFPVDLPLEFIAAWDGFVYEPFSGSGTTIIAAEKLTRQCRAVEIAPEYVAVALQRYQDAFGITPELIDGTTD